MNKVFTSYPKALAVFLMVILSSAVIAQHPSIGGYHVYYGHLHNHTGFSDGMGTPEQHYDDARRSGLDFLGIADHDWGLDDTKWGKVKAAAKAKTAEGKFLAFHGFEWT